MSITPEQLLATQQQAQDLNNRIMRLSLRKEAIDKSIAQQEAQALALYGTADSDKLLELLNEWEAENLANAQAFQEEVDAKLKIVTELEEALTALSAMEQ